MRQALLIAAYDSQLKWCRAIRDELAARGFEISVIAPQEKTSLSPQQIADAGFERVQAVSWPELVVRAAAADVVVSALAGPTTKALTMELSARPSGATRPVVVCGWVGIIIEKLVAGYLDRCGADVVAVNSVSDLTSFEEAAGHLGLPTGNLLLAGLPFVSARPEPVRGGPIRRVLFADQPTVPGRLDERLYVYDRLIAYAQAHPDREVLLKPRHRQGEDTFHRMRHHPELLLAGRELPGNFRIDYTAISEQLPTVDLLLTMSSTASLEGIDQGCRVAYVLDLGIHERLGNQVFLESGLLRTFAQITADELGEPEPDWVGSYFFAREQRSASLVADRVEDLLASGERPSGAVQDTAYFRGALQVHAALNGATRVSRSAWQRRIDRHGPVWGSARHVAWALTPPALAGAVRGAVRRG